MSETLARGVPMKLKTDQQAVGLFDAHLDPTLPEFHPAYLAARQYVLDIQPEILVFGGDWGTFDSLSSWNKDKPLLAENKRYKEEVKFCRDELYFLRNKLPNTKHYFLFGNHEQRAKWFVEKHPALEDFINVEKDLWLKELDMEVVGFNDFVEIGELAWTHGYFWTKYHARRHLDEFAGNVIYGHVHHFQSDTKNVHYRKKELIAHSIGCLTSRYPEWKGNKPTRFQNGFATVEYRSNGEFNINPHVIIGGAFSYGGFTWKI